MKKILSIIVSFVVLSTTFITAFADAAPFKSYTAIVDPGGATLYVTDKETEKVTEVKIPEFSKITVLSNTYYEDDNGEKSIYFVTYGKYSGNIITDEQYKTVFTQINSTYFPYETIDEEDHVGKIKYKDGLNLRYGPSTAYEVEKNLPVDTYVRYGMNINGWVFVNYSYPKGLRDSNGNLKHENENCWAYLDGITSVDKSEVPPIDESYYGLEEETTVKETTVEATTKEEITTAVQETTTKEVEEAVAQNYIEVSDVVIACIVTAIVVAGIAGALLMLINKKNKLKNNKENGKEAVDGVEKKEE